MAHNLVGKIVMVTPKRVGFALSAGSFTELPSNKVRPCIVTSVTEDGGVMISPMCGARYEKKNGIFVPCLNMIPQHWLSTGWQLQGAKALAAPQSEYDIILTLYGDPAKLEKGLPPFKPCYLWVGDVGEKLSKEEVLKLQVHVAVNPVGDKVLQFIKHRQAEVSAEDDKLLSQYNTIREALGDKIEKK